MRFFPFFHMQENPFGESPNPNFFYPTTTHRAALQKIYWALRENKAFLLVTGNAGSGKTLLSRVIFENLKANNNIAAILNPNLDPLNFLKSLYREFAIDEQADLSKLDTFASKLIADQKAGRQNILLVDEAQGLPFETLEFIRILTNLETENVKLLQVVLFAQTEILEKIQSPKLKQLQQRIFLNLKIERLTLEDSKEYISYRIEKSHGGNFVRFDDSAVRMIWTLSFGNPRIINKICEASLMLAENQQVRTITKNEIKRLPLIEMGIVKPSLLNRIFRGARV
jgi:general secretion pathway protein A